MLSIAKRRYQDVKWYTTPKTEEDRRVQAYWEALEASLPQEDQAIVELRNTLAQRRKRKEAIISMVQFTVGLAVVGFFVFMCVWGGWN